MASVRYDEIAVFVATDRRKYEQHLQLARSDASALNAQLAQADRRKDEFLATLAHELRNPLAPMRNVLEVLNLAQLDDPQLNWAREVLGRQVSHMTHLVDDLMEVSRITQGRHGIAPPERGTGAGAGDGRCTAWRAWRTRPATRCRWSSPANPSGSTPTPRGCRR